MERIQKSLAAAVLVSEISHIFCCVLPILFSIASLLAGLGVIGVMPGLLVELHEVMHGWEIPMIITSFVVLGIGWGLHFISRKIDCRDNGCGHGPCTPRKNKAHTILKAATILFLVNVSVYTLIHMPQDVKRGATVVMDGSHHGHAHHGHDHE